MTGLYRRFGLRGLLVTLGVLLAACGSMQVGTANGIGADGSCTDTGQLVALLSSGLPTFDFDVSADLEALVEESDLIVQGSLVSVVREDGESETGSRTRIVGFGDVLFASDPALEEEYFATESFVVSPSSHDGFGDDPLENLVDLDSGRTRFVAFLFSTGQADSPFATLIEGLHVSCTNDDLLQPVIERLPGQLSGTFDEIVVAVLDIVDPQVPRDEDDFESVAHRLLIEDVPAGEVGLARHVESVEDLRPEVGDVEVDFDSEVVFEFVVSESGSCPLGPLAGIEFNTVEQLLYPVTEAVERDGDCTADANPHLIVVAIAKSDLPADDFGLSTTAVVWPPGSEPTNFVMAS